jgi:hypothetical protein
MQTITLTVLNLTHCLKKKKTWYSLHIETNKREKQQAAQSSRCPQIVSTSSTTVNHLGLGSCSCSCHSWKGKEVIREPESLLLVTKKGVPLGLFLHRHTSSFLHITSQSAAPFQLVQEHCETLLLTLRAA